ncbi:hypothetical protein C8R45DRAFT_937507 [Mycena sanguinolenta]|nr:hypothetical protein C8R45DRAFT_937507 [Mycena sanguinolenta]
MDYQSHEVLALFNKSRHEIRGMQVKADDFVPFQNGRKLKISGTALNAVGALIKLQAERAGNSDFAIFSAWLSPLVSRQVPQNEIYGTIRSHIVDACLGAPLEILLAKSRWLFPMYGSDPLHWVLGWIEPGARLYHIFDSVPELRSVSWAEPALLELGDTVYATLGHLQIDWEPWRRVLHSPPEFERQMNNWACGFFVIHGMCVLAEGSGIENVKDSETERVREKTLKLVVDNIAYIFPYSFGRDPLIFEALKEQLWPRNLRTAGGTVKKLFQSFAEQATNDSMVSAQDVEMVCPAESPPVECMETKQSADPTPSTSETPVVTEKPSVGSKRKIEEPGREDARKSKMAKGAYTKVSDREKALEQNENIMTVEAHRVRCKACLNWVDLDKKVKFKLSPWDSHEERCPRIRGTVGVRTVVKKASTIVKGKGSIASFFGKTSNLFVNTA